VTLRALSLILAAALLVAIGQAQGGVVVKTQIEPATVMVGQQARLLVDVLFPGRMAHPPRVEMPSLDGAQIFRFESQATTIEADLAGQHYIGQRFEFDIYPRRDGHLSIPPARVTLLDESGNTVGRDVGSGQTLLAKTPPGFDASQSILASPAVTLHADWQPRGATLHVGDAVTLTVTRTAQTVPALSFSALPVPVIDGVRVYTEPPVITDHIERGDVTGIRTDRMTFVVEKPGHFVLPGLTQPWWNTDEGVRKKVIQPPFPVTVLADARTAKAPAKGTRLYEGCAVGALFIFGLGMLARYRHRRRPAKDSERAAYARLKSACRQADAQQAYRAARQWLSYRPVLSVDAEFSASLRSLERSVFGGGGWSAEAAERLCRNARTAKRRVRGAAAVTARRSSLPPLNPIED
jgi:hypothetical protein